MVSTRAGGRSRGAILADVCESLIGAIFLDGGFDGYRLAFVETPANPTLKLTDIRLAARVARDSGALLIVDNTLLTPALQRPFELGADVVLHSTTKFIEGHNATVGGALITRDSGLNEHVMPLGPFSRLFQRG